MPDFEGIGLPPPSSVATVLAARLAVAGGPGGADVKAEVDATQPDNAVGIRLLSIPYHEIDILYETISGVTVAVGVLLVVNTTNQMIGLHLRTKAVTPLLIYDGYAFPPGVTHLPLEGIEFTDGLEWKAGGAGLFGAFLGYIA